jgi:broad specificity phosphatase PhoE
VSSRDDDLGGDRNASETRVLLLRHAETAAPDCFHGAESDVGLGPRGVLQAEAAARFLAAYRPDAVLSSALRRARETAAPIAAACGRPVEVVAALHERRMGVLSGRPKDEGWDLHQSTRRRWLAGDLDASHEGPSRSPRSATASCPHSWTRRPATPGGRSSSSPTGWSSGSC